MSQRNESLIGKTITGVIAREQPSGPATLIMLQFSDGTCCEFVSPRWTRRLGRSQKQGADNAPNQLRLMPA